MCSIFVPLQVLRIHWPPAFAVLTPAVQVLAFATLLEHVLSSGDMHFFPFVFD